ncbi:histone-lysine N-methyltransferase SETMAR-like [Tribolium madens]|uniref:histone-lysine N-methyltransferase SETMAR-like n=1 Tax=Tribolium madens TaxID=41895 RepID=UPI001CF76289|nr:histone-lysine N-methyltransferase SETMAR-like [Tribolium madens]
MSQVNQIEYRAVIKFLTKEGLTPKIIKDRLDGVYGQSSPSYSVVKEWAKRFRIGQESLEDDARPGRPVEVITEDKVALVEKLVLSDRRLKVKEISEMTKVSDTSVRRILHDHLGMQKVSARWVSKHLSALQKQRRVECARSFLELCGTDPNPILETVVTGDETMVLYYDPLSKRESMEWRRKDFKETNTTVNGMYYASLLHKLRDNIREKLRGKLTRGVRLLHDNAPVHTAGVTQAAILDCGFQQIDHPPYSPDMAPSDYYLFGYLKKDLRGRRFSDELELYKEVIEDKCTKAWAVQKKAVAWEAIVEEFNCLAESGTRSVKQLKIFYENLKRETRKRVTQEHQEQYEARVKKGEARKTAAHDKKEIMKTGGGSSTLEMTSEQEILLATIREQVDPLDNAYDSAAEYFSNIHA